MKSATSDHRARDFSTVARCSLWAVLGLAANCGQEAVRPPSVEKSSAALASTALVVVSPTQDTSLHILLPNQNFGLTADLDVNRTLVQFDAAAINAAVGPHDFLLSAQLELTLTNSRLRILPRQVDVFRLTQAWTETGATWLCPNDTNTRNLLPDCKVGWSMGLLPPNPWVTPATSTVTIPAAQTGTVDFDVTADVRGFLTGTADNGWMLKGTTLGEFAEFASRESATPPQLRLTVKRCNSNLCDDGNPCTVDACDPSATCTHSPVADGTTCSDQNSCTRADACHAGTCVGGSPVVCTPLDQCHKVGVCDTTSGSCSNPLVPIGTTCSGLNVCDAIGSCVQCLNAGTCAGTDNACGSRTCTSGACGMSFVAAGIPCGTALVCDGGGSCVQACTPTTCIAQSSNCGSIADGCGRALNCGTCASPASCGGSGIPHVCGEPPRNCEQVGWRSALSSGQTSTALGVAADNSGNVYVVGRTPGLDGHTSLGGSDAFLAKVDGQGNRLWVRQLGSTCFVDGRSVATSLAGYIYVTGEIVAPCALPGNTSSGSNDTFLAQYDSFGNLNWVRQFGTGMIDVPSGVATDQDGNAYVVGDTGGSVDGTPNNGSSALVVLKYGFDGVRMWARQLAASSSAFPSANGRGISVDSTGNAFVAGTAVGSVDGNAGSGQVDLLLAKFGPDGSKSWSRQYGTSSGGTYVHGVALDHSGSAYVTGSAFGRFSESPTGGNVLIVKYDSAGNRVWTRQRGDSSSSSNGISTDTDSGVFVTGATQVGLDGQAAGGDGDSDPFVMKFTASGDWVWTQQDASPGYDLGLGVATAPDGSVFVAGDIIGAPDANHHRDYDAFVEKIDPTVCGP